MFEPFGLMVRLPKIVKAFASDDEDGGTGASPRLYRATMYAFWLLVCAIVIARVAMASQGSLFAFAS